MLRRVTLQDAVRWALLSKDFLISKVDTNNFIRKFVHTDAELDEILLAAQVSACILRHRLATQCVHARIHDRFHAFANARYEDSA